MTAAIRAARANAGREARSFARLLPAAALALAIVFVGLPRAGQGADAAAPGDVGVSSGEALVLLSGPPAAAGPAAGVPKGLMALAAAGAHAPYPRGRARPAGRAAVRRGRAQRWFAKRLLDGG